MKISELVEEIGRVKHSTNEMYKMYQKQKNILESLKEQLFNVLNESGIKSIKAKNYSAAIRSTREIYIDNETAVVEWLKNAPDVEYDAYVKLDKTAFKKFANEWFANTGEIIEGTDSALKETISVRENN